MLVLLRPRVRALWLMPSAPPPSPTPPLDAHQLPCPQPYPKIQKCHLEAGESIAPSAQPKHASKADQRLEKDGKDNARKLAERRKENQEEHGIGAWRDQSLANIIPTAC